MFKKYIKKLAILLIFLLNSGCITKNLSQKGYNFDNNDISNLNIGLTNKENTLKYLGYPLNKSYFNDNVWIYYSYKIREILFFNPKLIDQKMLIIEFDKDTEIIKNISFYNVNSNTYKLSNINNEYDKENQNIIKDILRNIGQISM